jgi:hypothetical protein
MGQESEDPMNKVVVDPDLRSRWNALDQPLEICDEQGKTLGHYLPAEQFNRLMYAVAEAQRPPLSDEEKNRRRTERGGRTLKEIWRSLGNS